MSPSNTETTYEWRKFSHRRTIVDAVQHDGTEHCRRAIAKAVRDGGGETLERPNGELFILGARGYLPLQPGEWCVRSIDVPGRGREFFPMGDDILTEAYDPTNGPVHAAVLDRDAVERMSRTLNLAPDEPTRDDLLRWCRLLVASHEALR